LIGQAITSLPIGK